MRDFRKVLETFRPSGQHSQEYRQEQANTGQACLGMPSPLAQQGMSQRPLHLAAWLVQHPQEHRQKQASTRQADILEAITAPVLHEYIRHVVLCSTPESTCRRRPALCASISAAQSILDSRSAHMLALVSWQSAICIVCMHRAWPLPVTPSNRC